MDAYITATGVALGALTSVPQEYYHPVTSEGGFASASIAKGNTAVDLAVTASREALRTVNINPNQLGAIIYVSILDRGSWCYEPAYDIAQKIKAESVPVFNVRQSCNGGVSALALAMNISENIEKPILLSISDDFNKSNLDRWQGDNAIFGDGAVSAVIGNTGGSYKIVAISSKCDNAQESETRGNLERETGERINFNARRAEFYRENNGMIPYLISIEKVIQDTIHSVLKKANLSSRDISWILTANINKPIVVQQLERFFNILIDRSGWKIGCEIGHLGAADQLVSLHFLEERGEIEKGQYIMLFGGGTGYNITIAILKKL